MHSEIKVDLSTPRRRSAPPQVGRRVATGPAPRGFTLIEIMVVVAIVAIIASIALPSYQDSVRKSRRADAVLALQRIQIEQEKFRAECPNYASDVAGTRTCNGLGLALATSSSDGYYNLNLLTVVNAATQYTATATAVTGTSQASDAGCTVLTLAVNGLTLTRTPAECWTR
jgi:type IV pilus assembly protein PilE